MKFELSSGVAWCMINEFLNLLVLINGSDPRLLRSPQMSNRGKHFEARG